MRRRVVRRAHALAFGAALAAVLAAAGCGEPRHPNLLIIVVDTLRADHLGAYGYARNTTPGIDALAAEGVVFERAYSTAPWTKPAVASLITGLHPSAHSVERMSSALPAEADTLAEILRRVGYETGAVVSHKLIGALFGFAQGYETFIQEDAQGHNHVSSPGVTRDATRLLAEMAKDERPFFLFVHYFDPHFAYRRHSEFSFAKGDSGRLKGGEAVADLRALDPPPDAAEKRFLVDSYDEEIRYTDEHITELLHEIDALGLRDETLVVFTADHGEEFYERGWLGHTRHLYDTLIRVPLIVRWPDGRFAGERVETPVSTTALLPTLLDALGFDASELALPSPSVIPLLESQGAAETVSVYSEVDYDAEPRPELWATRRSSNMQSLVLGRYKLVHDRGTDRYELYDLIADPDERADLAAAEPERVEELRTALEAAHRKAKGDAPMRGDAREIDGEERRMLESLGYVDP